jgi:capsular polysaccharide export protein
MSFWKRARMRAFLHDGTRAPPHAATPAALIAAAKGGAIACWSSRIPKGLAQAAARSGTPLMRVEDGFVRSRGLGSGFLPPCSIIVDATGIYYDPATPSDLETLLCETNFTAPLLERARRLTARMVRESVTKYAAGPAPLALPDAGGRRRVLVPGQVSDDLSVLRGGAGVAGNEDLLARVRARNPGAFIIYKPHPDVDAGHRAGRISDATARRHADCVIRDAPIAALITAVDEIHTLTSLAGFEALLRGRHVTTYGQPFYAGWGLTEDLAPPPRRGRRLTLEELSAGVLLLYPRYMDPVTELPCSAETLLDRLADPAAWRQTPLMRLRRLQGRIRASLPLRRRA